MTPRCQPSPSTTSRRSAAECGDRWRDGLDGASAAASVSRRSRFRRSSLAASSAARIGVAGAEQLDDFGGYVHAAGGVDARGEAEGDVEAGDLLCGGIERGGGEEGAQSSAGGVAQLAQAERGDGAIFAAERNGIGDGGDGGHLEKAGQGFFAGASRVAALEHSLGELESDGCAAERFFRIGATGLVGIENGEGVGNGVVRLGQSDGR